MTRSYHLHHFIALHIHADYSSYLRYFDREYLPVSRLSSGDKAVYTVHTHIVDTLPSSQPGDICRSVRFKNLFTHKFLIRDIHSTTVHLYFKHHPFARLYATAVCVFLQCQVLEPIVYMKLLDQDILLLHAAGVADGDAAYIFPAKGGTGKTSLSLALLDQGFTLLGDDLLLVEAATGRIFAYPRPLHLFRYNISQLHTKRVPLDILLAITVKDGIRWMLQQFTGERFLISTRVPITRLFPSIHFRASAHIAKIHILQNHGSIDTLSVTGHEERLALARTIVGLGDINTSLYTHILDEGETPSVSSKEVAVAEMLLAHIRTVSYINARSIDLSHLRTFADSLRS